MFLDFLRTCPVAEMEFLNLNCVQTGTELSFNLRATNGVINI